MVTLQRYEKPSMEKAVRKAMHSRQISDFTDTQRSVYETLIRWRISAAQANDESPAYVASNLTLQKISARLPGVHRSIKLCFALYTLCTLAQSGINTHSWNPLLPRNDAVLPESTAFLFL